MSENELDLKADKVKKLQIITNTKLKIANLMILAYIK